MAKTKIEWADAVWNPVTGCDKVSQGCRNCYAERMAKRLAGRYGYPADEPFRVTLHPEKLNEPLSWHKPKRVFVCSMSDLFHPDVPFDFIDQMFKVMELSQDNIFMILTKRPERMKSYFEKYITSDVQPHVWLGISAENQTEADKRTPVLFQIPAAVHFISAEPLLSSIDLMRAYGNEWPLEKLDLVICGGESGRHARPMHPDWVRSLRDQCLMTGTKFFFKQWGEWLPNVYGDKSIPEGIDLDKPHYIFPDGLAMVCVGKKTAGRLLDGREWNEMPEAARDG